MSESEINYLVTHDHSPVQFRYGPEEFHNHLAKHGMNGIVKVVKEVKATTLTDITTQLFFDGK